VYPITYIKREAAVMKDLHDAFWVDCVKEACDVEEE
jgi:hypothetical protein